MGQAQVAKIVNAFMASSSWNDSVFFFGYDEGGGPYDHVPPVPGHSNDFTDASLGTIPDIGSIVGAAGQLFPLPGRANGTPKHHALRSGLQLSRAHAGDAAAVNGFGAQIGFRVPNFVISPFTRRHYVSHIPMDHTAIIKFVENRFISVVDASDGPRCRAAEPAELLRLHECSVGNAANPPAPVTASTLGHNPCTPTNLGP